MSEMDVLKPKIRAAIAHLEDDYDLEFGLLQVALEIFVRKFPGADSCPDEPSLNAEGCQIAAGIAEHFLDYAIFTADSNFLADNRSDGNLPSGLGAMRESLEVSVKADLDAASASGLSSWGAVSSVVDATVSWGKARMHWTKLVAALRHALWIARKDQGAETVGRGYGKKADPGEAR